MHLVNSLRQWQHLAKGIWQQIGRSKQRNHLWKADLRKKWEELERKIIEFKKDFTITVPIIYNLREKAQFTVFF